MKGSHNSSFIPKNNPTKLKQGGKATRKIYAFTLVSYVILFATLIATAGVYFYEKHINEQLATEVTLLGQEVSSFNLKDMQRVVELDERLKQAQGRLENLASPFAIFNTLEEVIVSDAQIETLNVIREGDGVFVVQADMLTDSFDSTILQRKEYFKNEIIDSVNIANIVTDGLDYTVSNQVNIEGRLKPEVRFDVNLRVPVSSVLYNPDADYGLEFVSRFTEDDVGTNLESENPDEETDIDSEFNEADLVNNESL